MPAMRVQEESSLGRILLELWGHASRRLVEAALICADPRCTGVHNRNQPWATLCPRTIEAGLARERRQYAAKPWQQLHAKQLRNRRWRALKRIEARRLSG